MTYITENGLSLIMNCTSSDTLQVEMATASSGGGVLADSYAGTLTTSSGALTPTALEQGLTTTPVTLATVPATTSGVNIDRGSFDAYSASGNYLNGSWFGSVSSTVCSFDASAEFNP